MIPKKTCSYLSGMAAILNIKSYPNRQQCNLWTVMMRLCENSQIESWQIQMGENETYILSGYICDAPLHV